MENGMVDQYDTVIEAIIDFKEKNKDYWKSFNFTSPFIIRAIIEKHGILLKRAQIEKHKQVLKRNESLREERKRFAKAYGRETYEPTEEELRSQGELDFNDLFGNKELFEAIKEDELLFFQPRMMELKAQYHLSWIELVGRIDYRSRSVAERCYVKDDISHALWYFLEAGRLYERIGKFPEAHNVWTRAYLACKNILNHEYIESITKAVLYETMGICKILLKEEDIHECFKTSYEILFKEHKRRVAVDRIRRINSGITGLTAEVIDSPVGPVILTKETFAHIEVDHSEGGSSEEYYELLTEEQVEYLYAQEEEGGGLGIAWNELDVPEEQVSTVKEALEMDINRKGVEWIYTDPSYSIIPLNEEIFHERLNPKPNLYESVENLDIVAGYISPARSYFYMQHTEGM